MLSDTIRSLIMEEQERQCGQFIQHIDLEQYINKLDTNAEIISYTAADCCRGFIAFYCNNTNMKQAFISLLLININNRGLGLGRVLLNSALWIARSKGFTTCALEVCKENQIAYNMDVRQGFSLIEEKHDKYLLVCNLKAIK